MIQPAEIQVRYSDLDVLGHVNNCVYLSYFEMARVHYFGQLLGQDWDWEKNGVILVKNEVEYHLPVLLHHKPTIAVRTEDIGNKSFTLSYKIYAGDQLMSTGKSILVCYDSRRQKTVTIPSEMMKALEQMRTEQ